MMLRSLLLMLFLAVVTTAAAQQRVLVLYDGEEKNADPGRGDAVQLAQLLGHFRLAADLQPVSRYATGQMERYDAVFFIGFRLRCSPPRAFLRDMAARKKTAVWMHTGILAFDSAMTLSRRYGFTAVAIDTAKGWSTVQRGADLFTKTEPNITLCRVTDPSRCAVLATARSKRKGETPYVLRSGNFWYVADSPFASAEETDRYLLFADMLHDILGVRHPASHRALIRIEDVHPLEDPDHLRAIADLLHDAGVPFLVSVIPFYVDPEQGLRVSLTDKPELVDALLYMGARGGGIVMHGCTHQYKGLTASDYEFWDIGSRGPIRDETVEGDREKLARGIDELLRNGIHPILWETPHYTGSEITYAAAASVFSTAMEQRGVVNSDNTQFFPYVIERDIHGQRIFPENLGYVPVDPDDPGLSGREVERIIAAARVNLGVRDGFASCFFHPFVPLQHLQRLIDGIRGLGYTYMDLRHETNAVRLPDRVVMTGGGDVSVHLEDQYLREYWFGPSGVLERTRVSPRRSTGVVTRHVALAPGAVYVASPAEIRSNEPTLGERILRRLRGWYTDLFPPERPRNEMRAAVLWDPRATGGGMLDQQSFLAALRAAGVRADTLLLGARFDAARYNTLIVPHPAVDRLRNPQFSALVEWVRAGGNVVTDGHNDFSLDLGLRYTGRSLGIDGLSDRMYPEDPVEWRRAVPLEKFEADEHDHVYAVDNDYEAPVVVGRRFGRGRVLYLGTRFDPVSGGGYAFFPHLLHYMADYFDLHPVFRRDALELYFDPGFRNTVPVENLVRRWAGHGVRAIHVASWHEYPRYTYDYARLVRLCHENGILVYAWIEPPQVSHKFWLEHPQWREKNPLGKDNRASWRFPLAMTDTAAVAAMLAKYGRFLRKHNFDGVNIAETYFESDIRGPAMPGSFAPMHPSARAEFRRLRGFDPIALFEPGSPRYWKSSPASWKLYEDYRVDKVVEMHRRLLRLAHDIRRHRNGFGIVVTMLDDLGTPDLRRSQGIDIRRIMDLRAEVPFTLAVEDPMARWSDPPERYREMAATYRPLLGDDFALDVNILRFRDPAARTLYPTLLPTGTEANALLHVTGEVSRRTLVYSESSVNPQDIGWLAFAASSPARITGDGATYRVSTPVSLAVHFSEEQKFLLVDGAVRTAAGDGRFLIPAGDHAVTRVDEGQPLFDEQTMHASLRSCTGNLLALEEGVRSVTFTYESGERCYVTINKEPEDVYVDGRHVDVPIREGVERYSVQLPPGRHEVLLVTQGTVSYSIDLTSLFSSTLIVLFGFVSLGLLTVLYAIVRMGRRRAPAPVQPPPYREGL